jgi:hypothetical protein
MCHVLTRMAVVSLASSLPLVSKQGNEQGCLAPRSSGATTSEKTDLESEPVAEKPFCMRRGAEVQTDQGPRLSERSEFELAPGWTEHRRLPAAKRRDADSRVAFLFLRFLWRDKEK